MVDIAFGALLLALAASTYASIAFLLGARRRLPELLVSARNGIWAALGLVTVATGLLGDQSTISPCG